MGIREEFDPAATAFVKWQEAKVIAEEAADVADAAFEASEEDDDDIGLALCSDEANDFFDAWSEQCQRLLKASKLAPLRRKPSRIARIDL